MIFIEKQRAEQRVLSIFMGGGEIAPVYGTDYCICPTLSLGPVLSTLKDTSSY